MVVETKANYSGEAGTQLPGLTPACDTEFSSEIDDPRRALDGCRQYLLMIANEVIGPELQAKIGASDLVQDTFVEAQRHLAGFRGTSNVELRAWLRKILECRLSNLRRAYLATGKARPREVAIETLLVASEEQGDVLASRVPSPSSHAMRSELYPGPRSRWRVCPSITGRPCSIGTRTNFVGRDRPADALFRGCGAHGLEPGDPPS